MKKCEVTSNLLNNYTSLQKNDVRSYRV